MPLLCCCLLIQTTHAQKIQNVAAQVQGSQVVITYDLNYSGTRSLSYNVAAYRSTDGGTTFNTPLSQVTGDVGGVGTGTGKRIVWSPLKVR